MFICRVCSRVFVYCDNKQLTTCEEIVEAIKFGKKVYFDSDTISESRGEQYIQRVKDYIKFVYDVKID